MSDSFVFRINLQKENIEFDAGAETIQSIVSAVKNICLKNAEKIQTLKNFNFKNSPICRGTSCALLVLAFCVVSLNRSCQLSVLMKCLKFYYLQNLLNFYKLPFCISCDNKLLGLCCCCWTSSSSIVTLGSDFRLIPSSRVIELPRGTFFGGTKLASSNLSRTYLTDRL